MVRKNFRTVHDPWSRPVKPFLTQCSRVFGLGSFVPTFPTGVLCLLFFYSLLLSEIAKGENMPTSRVESESVNLGFQSSERRERGKIPMNYSESVGIHFRYKEDERFSVADHLFRARRGFFDKEKEKQRLEEEYYRSFRLFWFLGGVAIIFFILIFILTLLCFCCPNLTHRKPKTLPVPRISVPKVETVEFHGDLLYPASPGRVKVDDRPRSPSVYSISAPYVSQHRLSQEMVNAIQLESQSRRNSALPSTSQGLLPPPPPPTSALIDVNVVQEQRPDPVQTSAC